MSPHLFTRGRRLAVAVLLLALASPTEAQDNRRPRENWNQRNDQQILQAQQRLDAIQREESQLNRQIEQYDKDLPEIRKQLETARDEVRQSESALGETRQSAEKAREAVRAAAKHLGDVEGRIEANLEPTSDVVKAKAAYEAAKQAYQQAVASAERSPEYKAACEDAQTPASKTALRREWIDKNPAVIAARAKLLETKKAYEKLRDALFQSRPEWREATEACQKAKDQEQQVVDLVDKLAGQFTAKKKASARKEAEIKRTESALQQARRTLQQYAAQKQPLERLIENERRSVNRWR